MLYLEGVPSGLGLKALLDGLADIIIPEKELTDSVRELMYVEREINFEDDDAIEALSSLEFVLDAFDANDRKELEKEIGTAKSKKADMQTFKKDVCEWKVLRMTYAQIIHMNIGSM